MKQHERNHVMGSALAALTLLCIPAVAAVQADDQANDQGTDQRVEEDVTVPVEPRALENENRTVNGVTTVTGELHSYQRLNLQGQGDGHTLVRVRLKDGRARIVDLGPRATPFALAAHQGERVRLQGRMERIGGMSVLLADRITVEGGDVLVSTASPVDAAASIQPASYLRATAAPTYDAVVASDVATTETIAGRILGSWRFPFSGTNSTQTLVKLSIENDVHVIVDFGSERTLDLIDPEKGDFIWMSGLREQVSGIPIFRVERVDIAEAPDVRPGRDAQED